MDIKYYVIGGQYCYKCYGGASTLAAAKRLANANQEYWDNWQGWHTPAIYRAEDTVIRYDDFWGYDVRVPDDFVWPVDDRER